MRWISLAAPLLVAACAASAEPLVDQIEKNWLVPFGTPCHREIIVRVSLASDGAVKSAAPTEPVAADDAACSTIMESVKRALLISSPLRFDGDVPPSVLLRFKPETWLR